MVPRVGQWTGQLMVCAVHPWSCFVTLHPHSVLTPYIQLCFHLYKWFLVLNTVIAIFSPVDSSQDIGKKEQRVPKESWTVPLGYIYMAQALPQASATNTKKFKFRDASELAFSVISEIKMCWHRHLVQVSRNNWLWAAQAWNTWDSIAGQSKAHIAGPSPALAGCMAQGEITLHFCIFQPDSLLRNIWDIEQQIAEWDGGKK